MFQRKNLFSLALIVLLGLSTSVFAQQSDTVQLTIQPDSKMQVNGNSTLHKWSADVKEMSGYFKVPSAILSSDVKTGQEFSEAKITVPVEKLDSGEGGMNKKMYGALNKKKHPNITYSLTSAKVTAVSDTSFTLDTQGNLTISGNTKSIEMTVTGYKTENGSLRFKGKKDMKMTDFGVNPPSALFGTIKSDDDISVSFNVLAKSSGSAAMNN